MAGKKKRRGGKRKMTVPLLVVAGMAGPAADVAYIVRYEGIGTAGYHLVKVFTGYDTRTRQWSYQELYKGLIPVMAGMAGHMLATKLGINRMLSRWGIPYIRL